MPIEIRELTIKTEISTAGKNNQVGMRIKDFNILKKQLLAECEKIVAEKTKRGNYKR